MARLVAPPDLYDVALPFWLALTPGWEVFLAWAEIDGARGETRAESALSQAWITLTPRAPPADLLATLAHEFTHVAWWQVTEMLDHSDPRTRALIEPVTERFAVALSSLPAPYAAAVARASASLSARALTRTKTPRALAREGDCSMDLSLMLASLRAISTAADVGASLSAFITELAALPEAAGAAPAAEDMGTPIEMMRKALARAKPPPDTLGSKVLVRLGVKTESEALLRIAALQIADTQVAALGAADDSRERKAAVIETMKRTGLARTSFYVDGKDELLPEWNEGTVDEVKRTLGTLKRGAVGRAPVVPNVETEHEIPAAVRNYAERKGKGADVKYMQRLASELANGGSLPQES